ncbi:GAF domain-like protein [Triangularia verruculosa]|uniref:GAF domain-like protein n=1 Tax=Triangularia verruculosa TaxID=2587418 RepID=A0AAN7AQ73_9PEZI|nr:GAF domain-like protein [Triangularia verruculosa]
MVHADATSFPPNLSKPQAYQQLLDQVEGLCLDQRNWVCNLSNTSSLLWHLYHSLPSPASDVNWAGFYVYDHTSPPAKPRLILGPFQGKVACQTIAFGRGVCGTAAATQTTQLVPDVEKFPGHIACDSASKSEIVVPIIVEGKGVVAIIDIDCTVENGFDQVDKEYLEKLADFLAKSSDWP